MAEKQNQCAQCSQIHTQLQEGLIHIKVCHQFQEEIMGTNGHRKDLPQAGN
jgi:hypothetical protein